MKKQLILVWLLIVGLAACSPQDGAGDSRGSTPPARTQSAIAADTSLADAIAARRSNTQVAGEGVVSKILSDDNKGSRHQRFIVRLAGGETILIAHNIDLAPRIDALKEGGTIRFFGEYEWNDKGGVVHWTHRDPKNIHPAGWLQYEGRTYQ